MRCIFLKKIKTSQEIRAFPSAPKEGFERSRLTSRHTMKNSIDFSGVDLKTFLLNQVRIQPFFFRYTFNRKIEAKNSQQWLKVGCWLLRKKHIWESYKKGNCFHSAHIWEIIPKNLISHSIFTKVCHVGKMLSEKFHVTLQSTSAYNFFFNLLSDAFIKDLGAEILCNLENSVDKLLRDTQHNACGGKGMGKKHEPLCFSSNKILLKYENLVVSKKSSREKVMSRSGCAFDMQLIMADHPLVFP